MIYLKLFTGWLFLIVALRLIPDPNNRLKWLRMAVGWPIGLIVAALHFAVRIPLVKWVDECIEDQIHFIDRKS